MGGVSSVHSWRDHARWEATNKRNVAQIAREIVRLHSNCWETLQSELRNEEAEVEAVAMMDDLYRYITTYLCTRRNTTARRSPVHRIYLSRCSPRSQERAVQGPLVDERYAALIIEAYDEFLATLAGEAVGGGFGQVAMYTTHTATRR